MTKEESRKRIEEIGIIPVIRASSMAEAKLAAEAVCAGGITIAEVTMTVPGALDAIAQLAKTIGGDVLIGAGTVLDALTAQRCIDSGAEFLVSPGFDYDTVLVAKRLDKLIMVGALTPTEVITAWKAGSDFVKIFPCGAVGGARYLKALKAPLPQIPMIPTGGVNLNTVAEFIQAGAAALGVGAELCPAAALESKRVNEITEAARKYLAAVAEARRAL
jgi:2-dehydro-3-deoxyphosphogluconate aldolase/(4S)-4-hydroxy-2-oxoglutarate aldolase